MGTDLFMTVHTHDYSAGPPLPDILLSHIIPLTIRDGVVERVEHPSPNFADSGIQTNDLKIDTRHFLVRHSALLGEVKDWLVQYQDIVTDLDVRSSVGGLVSKWNITIKSP